MFSVRPQRADSFVSALPKAIEYGLIAAGEIDPPAVAGMLDERAGVRADDAAERRRLV